MDTTKQLAKAVINKDFAQAKDLVFKSLYARASLALDEARYTVAQSIYNSTTEVNEGSWGGGFETSREAWAKHMKQERLEAKRAREAKKAKEKAAAKAKKAVKEETEQIDEISKATKDSYVAKRGSQMSSMMRGPEKNYASMTGKKQANAVKGIKRAMGVKEETEQLDEVMTRKHFQQVADVIKAHPDAKKREELAAHHSQIFKKSNPRFDEGRFRKACGIGGCKESVEVGGEQLDEVSPPGMEKMTGSPRVKASFKKQYGKRGKSVMYATAWKMHNKKKD